MMQASFTMKLTEINYIRSKVQSFKTKSKLQKASYFSLAFYVALEKRKSRYRHREKLNSVTGISFIRGYEVSNYGSWFYMIL